MGLRKQPSRNFTGATYIHHPFPAGALKYDSRDLRVQTWVVEALTLLDDEVCKLPVLVHCSKGVDRTGLVISALLMALAVPFPIVAKEYALSPGADELKFHHFWSELLKYEPRNRFTLRNPHRFAA